MADTKISALSAASALDGTEPFPVVQSGATVKVTGQQAMTLITGSASLPGATVTTSKPLLNQTQTWNDAAVAFTGWKLNITNTASDAASLLADLQVGGASKFNVNKDGAVTTGGGSAAAPALHGGASDSGIYFAGNNVRISADGTLTAAFTASTPILRFGNYAGVGWTTTSDPGGTVDLAINRKAASVLEINNGTPATYAGSALVISPQTVAQLPAAATAGAGARAFVTDGSTTLILGLGLAVTGSGANKVPVYSDGTNWIVG